MHRTEIDSNCKILHFGYVGPELGNVERDRRSWEMTLKGIDIGFCRAVLGLLWSGDKDSSGEWELPVAGVSWGLRRDVGRGFWSWQQERPVTPP